MVSVLIIKTFNCLNMQGGRPPYVFVFDHKPVFSTFPEWAGATHAEDVPFVFGVPLMNITGPLNFGTSNFSDTEKGFSLYVMKLWTDFAKYG